MAKLNVFHVKTVPVDISLNTDSKCNNLELEDWICKKIAGGNLSLAKSIKTLHRKEIEDIRNLMLTYIDGRICNDEVMQGVLESAMKELRLSSKKLRDIRTTQVIQLDTGLMLSLKRN